MAGQASRAELDEARAELARVNEQHGFRHARDGGRPDSPAPSTGGGDVAEAEGVPANSGPPTAPVDPGPPRFIGVDLEHSLAGLSGGGWIPISPGGTEQIVAILLVALREHMQKSLGTIAASHKQAMDPAQLAIEFPDGPRGD